MKYFYIFGLALTILFANACQSSEKKVEAPKAKPVFINYEVRYLELERELRALVSFKEGDSFETATSKSFSNINFQGSAMESQNLGQRGIRYILNRKGVYSSNLDFGYKNDDGIPITYDLTMPEVGEFSIKEGSISKNKGATIVWNGEPLDASQSLVFMFTDKDNKASSISIKGPTDLSEAFISSKRLADLSLGAGQLYLVKKQVKNTKDENQTIISVVEYYTSPIDIKTVQ